MPVWSPRERPPILTAVPNAVRNEELDYRRRLGPAIVQLRSLAGLSQADLSELIGRSEAAVSRWETAKATPSAWDLREIARVTKLEDDQLDVLLRPPKGPISPVAERLARAGEAGARKGRAAGVPRRVGGRGV